MPLRLASRRFGETAAVTDKAFRVERDSMGDLKVPADALWGAQTQRAVENFPISGLTLPRAFLRALGLVKWAAAEANERLGLLPGDVADSIRAAALEVADGKCDAHFPSTYSRPARHEHQLNANEVVASLASRRLGRRHANVTST
jgi:fumarate hydratase class II